MTKKPHSPLDSVLGRLDNLDEVNLQNLVNRLARERRLLETVFNTIREGLLVIDRKGLIVYANAAAARLLGFSLKDVGQAILWKRVPDLARSLHLDVEGQLDALAGITREIALSYPDPRVLRLYLMPVREDEAVDAQQEIVGESQFAVILTDITEEKAQTEQQIESEKIDSILKLAAGVAHELGNPLNSLTIHQQLMKRQLQKMPPSAEREKLEKALRISASEVARLDNIIRHFLEAVRPTPLDLHDIDIVQVIEESLEVMRPELESAGLQIDVTIDDALPVIEGDDDLLKQVFFNLFKNAREATPAGGEIRLRIRADDEFVFVLLGDTGKGISDEELAKVFDPYFTTKDTGHGLGMMMVQRILRDHGASIGIDSQPGVGTVVTVQFPQKHRRVRLLQGG